MKYFCENTHLSLYAIMTFNIQSYSTVLPTGLPLRISPSKIMCKKCTAIIILLSNNCSLSPSEKIFQNSTLKVKQCRNFLLCRDKSFSVSSNPKANFHDSPGPCELRSYPQGHSWSLDMAMQKIYR